MVLDTVVEDERYHFDAADLDRVQRRLKQRHVQMYVSQFSLPSTRTPVHCCLFNLLTAVPFSGLL